MMSPAERLALIRSGISLFFFFALLRLIHWRSDYIKTPRIIPAPELAGFGDLKDALDVWSMG